MQKRILAVHDISCVGKCSLTVALPILSAAGFETAVLPTAVLSTHTAGFTGFTCRDLTDDIRPIMDHWEKEGITFDAIYTGYLASFEQIDLVKELIRRFRRENTVVLVDPVMADNGQMYPAFDENFAAGMATLCAESDIVIPNLTEASFMLKSEYRAEGYDEGYIRSVLKSLTDLGPKSAVLTGVTFENGTLGAAAYDAASDKMSFYVNERLEGAYHGTGDVFGSAFLAAYMAKGDLSYAIRVAVDYTLAALRRTKIAGTPWNFGVDFENSTGDLLRLLDK